MDFEDMYGILSLNSLKERADKRTNEKDKQPDHMPCYRDVSHWGSRLIQHALNVGHGKSRNG